MHPQDPAIGIKLLTHGPTSWTFATLGDELGLSASQTHASYKRLIAADLVSADLRLPIKRNLVEFITHGLRYVFPAAWSSAIDTGIPTAHSSSEMKTLLKGEGTVIWPWKSASKGVKGRALQPIHKCVPLASTKDARFYAIFAAIDSLRIGGARERGVAQEVLERLILDL